MFVRIGDWFFKRYFHFTAGCEKRPISIPAVLPILSVAMFRNMSGGKRPTFDLSHAGWLHRWFLAWAVLTGRMDALDWGNPETGPSIGAAVVMLPGVFEGAYATTEEQP